MKQHAFDETLLPQDHWTPNSAPAGESYGPPLSGFLLKCGERPTCGAPGCENILRFWRRSARPVFDGQWACSRDCALKLVHASIRRQAVSFSTSAEKSGTHRHRIPLGLVLLHRGVVTQAELRLALDAQRSAGHGRIGDWLEETCRIAPEKITLALAAQWNRPVLSANGFQPVGMANVMPAALRKELRLLPLRLAAGKILYAAVVDEVDVMSIRALERMTGLVVEAGLLPHDEFAATEARLSLIRPTGFREEFVADATELAEHVVRTLFDEQPVASRLVSVRCGWWLRLWLEPGACSAIGTLPATGEDVIDVLFRR
jgi:hypothetical protein